jgi:hypothetical protein
LGAIMEIRISLGLLALLLGAAIALTASRPQALYDATSADTRALAVLEDAASQTRGNLELVRKLATTYLRLGQPGLAIAAIRNAPPEQARDALLTHRLSQAYEASGRVEDALNTALLASARCSSAHACSPATAAALEMHAEALATLTRWGVQDPRRDTRTALAYRLAQRTARIASLGMPAANE